MDLRIEPFSQTKWFGTDKKPNGIFVTWDSFRNYSLKTASRTKEYSWLPWNKIKTQYKGLTFTSLAVII